MQSLATPVTRVEIRPVSYLCLSKDVRSQFFPALHNLLCLFRWDINLQSWGYGRINKAVNNSCDLFLNYGISTMRMAQVLKDEKQHFQSMERDARKNLYRGPVIKEQQSYKNNYTINSFSMQGKILLVNVHGQNHT